MKKFVLLPFKQWQEWEKLQHLDELDRELLAIIKRTDLEVVEKLEAYKNLIQPSSDIQVGTGLDKFTQEESLSGISKQQTDNTEQFEIPSHKQLSDVTPTEESNELLTPPLTSSNL